MQFVPMTVGHTRIRPWRNAFRYRMNYIAITLEEIERRARCRFFSVDRRNLFSLRSSDYGDPQMPLRAWINGLLRGFEVDEAGGEIALLTLPRVLGYAFNPVSFWFCCDQMGQLRAVIAQVNNTFGERHVYVCFHPDRAPIEPASPLVLRKDFHVSPFLEVKGRYCFRFDYCSGRIAAFIDFDDGDGPVLATSMTGKPRPLSDAMLLRSCFLSPLQAIKVIALIHFQAARLYLKGIAHVRKPPPPTVSVSPQGEGSA